MILISNILWLSKIEFKTKKKPILLENWQMSSYPLSSAQCVIRCKNVGLATNVIMDRIKYAGLSFGKQSEIEFELFLVDNGSIA